MVSWHFLSTSETRTDALNRLAVAHAWLLSVSQERRWTMLRLTIARRRMLIDKLPDAANLALAGLVFGQFVGSRLFSAGIAAAGLITWAAFLGAAFFLGGDE